MDRVSLEAANCVITATFEKATQLSLKPLAVAVVDQGGNLISLQRQNLASNLRPQIALGKACGALALGMSSRKIGEMASDRPSFVAAVAQLAEHGIVPAAGGIIIVDRHGQSIGAVGVTGDTSDNDELCALAGIEAAGLSSQE